MNKGDLAVEVNDMSGAMREYGTAMRMLPENLEMQYWTAVTLANNKEVEKSLVLFKTVFSAEKKLEGTDTAITGCGIAYG